jgi:hypothetical protein
LNHHPAADQKSGSKEENTGFEISPDKRVHVVSVVSPIDDEKSNRALLSVPESMVNKWKFAGYIA